MPCIIPYSRTLYAYEQFRCPGSDNAPIVLVYIKRREKQSSKLKSYKEKRTGSHKKGKKAPNWTCLARKIQNAAAIPGAELFQTDPRQLNCSYSRRRVEFAWSLPEPQNCLLVAYAYIPPSGR